MKMIHPFNVGRLRRAIQDLPDEAPILLYMDECPNDNLSVELVDIVNHQSERAAQFQNIDPHVALVVSIIDEEDVYGDVDLPEFPQL